MTTQDNIPEEGRGDMKLRYIFNSQRLAIHKIRFDRGGMYLGYLTGLGMATILVKIFNIKSWWVYVLGGGLILGYRYIAGYLDEKKQILKKEQSKYADENPWNEELMKQIHELNAKLDVLLKENTKKS